MEVANTLAYYNTATITAVKSFIIQGPEDQDLVFSQVWQEHYVKNKQLKA
jgi:hypothetical protein